jgi:site-specific DNA recombinase
MTFRLSRKVEQMIEQSNSKLRAVGYSRTSSEGQRDNTSIPRQKDDIEKYIANNGWVFLRHYEDESKSWAKIEGRDDFKRMMKDAINGQFDIVVIYAIDRFARDGSDIISESKVLKRNFGVDVIDTKGFDTRDPRNVMMNFVRAGMSQEERLRIMERTIRARIHNAENGMQWSPKLPFGRDFIKTDKHSGEWQISEDGKKIKTILESYVNDNKSFRELAREHGILSGQHITRLVREAQLAASPYKAIFNSPDIGIVNYEVMIPAVPAVISQKLEKCVLEKMGYNQKNKRSKNRNYLLSGFVRCSHCGKLLKGQSQRNRSYFTHNNFYANKKPCPYNGIRLELLENHVMDYLTEFFFNKPAFDNAIKAALPTGDDREAIVKDIDTSKRALNKANTKISNLVKAIANGADISLLLDTQNQLKAEKQALEKREAELQETLQTMPNSEIVKAQAEYIRGKMLVECLTKDWQKMPYEDVRRFLHFLFSDNPQQNNYGIFLGKQGDKWNVDFEGCFDFNHIISAGKPELKDGLSDDKKAKIADKMKAKDTLIETFKKYEDIHDKAERLESLINQAKKLEKAGLETNGNRLFIDKNYL